jgi:hypothetical protein
MKGTYRADTSYGMKAEFSPWLKIFDRLENIVNNMVEASFMVHNDRNTSYVEPYFNWLRELLCQLYPMMTDEAMSKFMAQVDDIERDIEDWRNLVHRTKREMHPNRIIKKLDALKTDTLIIKQVLGMSIPAQKVEKIKSKLNKVLDI